MFRHGLLVCGSILVLGLSSTRGQEPLQPGPLDLIPADAVAAIAIRNASDLVKRGDALVKEAALDAPDSGLSAGYS